MTEDDILHKMFVASQKGIARFVSRIVPPREIEDIVQETYVRICQVENKSNIVEPQAYLYKTAKNLALDYVKRSEVKLVDSNEQAEHLSADSSVDSVFQEVSSNETFSQFCEAVRLLPVQCRKVFVLKRIYGYSQKDIATKLDISPSTVEKHVALGIKRCTYHMMQNDLESKERYSEVKSRKTPYGEHK